MKITRRPAGPIRLPAATMSGAWFMIFSLWLVASALPDTEAAAAIKDYGQKNYLRISKDLPHVESKPWRQVCTMAVAT